MKRGLFHGGFYVVLIGMLLVAACAPERKPANVSPQMTQSAVELKKKRFFTFLKPVVEQENHLILKQRHLILQLMRKPRLNRRNQAMLDAIAEEYGLEPMDWGRQESWSALLARVDIVPVGLVLVQAANESAWGSSRFAREGNNYFGEWCYQKGCGIVPLKRSPGATHEVRRFASVQESVHSYMHNLNSSPAYARFRRLRAEARARGEEPDALTLANGLEPYSERGQSYVRTLQLMLRQNARFIQG